ncbi:probable methyltransferase PMT24 [Ricinus communis]|uniref:ATP binding protein, putative n=1 Tax=Ricinus communis TaxID=3988 RepID=B9S2Q5_RICCO|nr:probable methyltransferase PMT24 [Ricinus communis]EEF42060.1 ATP binding protein, putative [Ricinus communis]|eukprot:XP_002520274.1 probable methyltransferase PMT24 [Ricinus communis]
MAMGKYSRVDGRKSSSYFSTIAVVVFVALCLVGVWMLMSSTVAPVQNSNSPSQETVNEVKQTGSENTSKQFEDSSGDLPEDATKEDGTAIYSQSENQSGQDDQNMNIIEKETAVEDNKEEKAETENQDEKTESLEEPKKEAENDGDGKTGDGEAEGGETNKSEQTESEEASGENKSEFDEGGKDSDKGENTDENGQEEKDGKQGEQSSNENNMESQEKDQASVEVFPAGSQSELLNETDAQNGAWSTQAVESQNEKKSQQSSISKDQYAHGWKLCNVTAGPDYIPCLDNWQAIRKLPSTKHYEHRERHCPEEAPTCLVPVPEGYRRSIKWPKSREKIWYYNVPHTKLAEVKGHQNWVKVTGEYLTFPGGGTQFKHGALHYIDFIENSLPDIAWGKRSRVILDVGCGVASFGGFLSERDVLAMSLAPKDEHEAQVQFALERGIPAVLAVMGTKRLPFPSSVFDIVHCARCRVPWHIEGGKLLLELNRLLRPGGYFVWSATPVYQKLPEDVGIWQAMTELTKSMCWDLIVIKKDTVNGIGAAIFRKPTSNECYNKRSQNEPPLCKESDDRNAAWNVPLEACMHKVPEDSSERGSQWPEQWPQRLETPPYWLKSQVGVYGKAAPEDFTADYNHWKHVVSQSYLNGMGIDWSTVRNAMDMRAVYGGFAAALKDLKVWVMNTVPIDSPDTLPIIYERGLFGMYHDWCESFNTYPRTYDLLHADHLFSSLKKRCNLVAVVAEVDRILRPEGKLIVRDNVDIIGEIESMAKSLKWEIRMIYTKDDEGLLCVRKTMWRPTEAETIKSAIM